MTTTTFTGYFPKLKGHREATVKSGKCINPKGSIRYQIKGECMDDEKGLCITLPKMVTREDFEQVYGFDAKEAESVFMADTVGSPSPASVEPPAPSEKPFPQEPSNENFSAENTCAECGEIVADDDIIGDGTNRGLCCVPDYYDEPEEKSMECPHCNEEIGAIDVKATCELCGGTLEEWIDYPSLVVGETEVKEAFLGFGKDDEEEPEEEKPKEQEFTVIMQEGDKLELTDIEETEGGGKGEKDGDNDGDSENDEKEAELLKHTLMICPACDETIPDDESCIECGTRLRMGSEYEAVQAKVTRPAKEEPKEEEEEDEGMSTLAKVGLSVGALAIGAAILGAEDEGELDYWAGENAHWRAEGGNADSTVVWELIQQNLNNPDTVRLYYSVIVGDPDEYEGDDMATTVAEAFQQNWRNEDFVNHISKELGFEAEGGGQIDHDRIDEVWTEEVIMRHDYPTTMYNWKTDPKDQKLPEGVSVHDIDDEVEQAVRDEVGDEPSQQDDGWRMDITEDVVVDVDYETDFGEGRFYGFAAEDFQKMTPSEYVPFDQMQEELGQMWDETTAPLADAHNYDYNPSNEPSNANFSAEKAHSYQDNCVDCGKFTKDSCDECGDYCCNYECVEGVFNNDGSYHGEASGNIVRMCKGCRDEWYAAETVGSPSPSGPSSVPEPAEATGSEPSNEHMEADSSNTKMMLGFTALGIGIAAVLGKDKLSKLFDRFGL